MRAIIRRGLLAAATLSLAAAAACSQPSPASSHPPVRYKIIRIDGPQKGNGPPGIRYGNIPLEYSDLWAGYYDRPTTLSAGEEFTYVQAYFTVPRLDKTWCDARPADLTHPDANTAFWVGLGGRGPIGKLAGQPIGPLPLFNSPNASIEQTGVAAMCHQEVFRDKDKWIPKGAAASGPQYLMWWESYPADPNYYAPVNPGDSMFASVKYDNSNRTYTGYLVDLTERIYLLAQYQRCMDTPRQPAADPYSSCDRTAEVIAETPIDATTGMHDLTAPFKSVSFSGAGVQNTGGESGSLTAHSWDAHELVLGSRGSELLIPSSIGQGEGCQPHPGYPAVCFGKGPSASVFDISNPNYAPTAPSATPTSSCTTQTFQAVVTRKDGTGPQTSGPPTCADGYAVETFIPYPGGQQAPFFFKQGASGQWTIIEGGDAIPTVACATIPATTMKKLHWACPPVTRSGPPNPTPAAPSASATPTAPGSSAPTTSATPAAPGQGTPQDAVDGFYQAELQGDWAAACSYVTPSAQSLCLAGTSGQSAGTGSFQVHNAVIVGGQALVSVTGKLCGQGNIGGSCVSNSDPSAGMPSSSTGFAAAYSAAVAASTSGGSTTMSPLPCTQIDGKWYVAFG